MRLSVRVAALAAGQLRFVLAPGIAGDPTADIRKALDAAPGQSWRVERLADGLEAMPSLEEARAAARAAEDAAILEDPLVRAAFAAFPGAEILKDVPISDRDTKSWSRRA
jgi:DNA polymerase-3 subunit gamma/tau